MCYDQDICCTLDTIKEQVLVFYSYLEFMVKLSELILKFWLPFHGAEMEEP